MKAEGIGLAVDAYENVGDEGIGGRLLTEGEGVLDGAMFLLEQVPKMVKEREENDQGTVLRIV